MENDVCPCEVAGQLEKHLKPIRAFCTKKIVLLLIELTDLHSFSSYLK